MRVGGKTIAQRDSQACWQEFLSISSLTLISRAESAVTDLENPFCSFSISMSPPQESEGWRNLKDVWAHPQSPLLFSKALYKPKEITETQISCLPQVCGLKTSSPWDLLPFLSLMPPSPQGESCALCSSPVCLLFKKCKWIRRQRTRKTATEAPLRAEGSRQVRSRDGAHPSCLPAYLPPFSLFSFLPSFGSLLCLFLSLFFLPSFTKPFHNLGGEGMTRGPRGSPSAHKELLSVWCAPWCW